MYKWILYIVALALLPGAKAQPSASQLEAAKFAILKKTVEFLSEDTAFKKVQSHTCASCKTVADLKQFANSNNLVNADSKLITPLANTPVDTAAGKWQQSLATYKQKAIDQVTGGKAYRTKLSSYSNYTAALNDIVANVQPTASNAATSTPATSKGIATATNDTAVDQTGIVPNGTASTNSLTDAALTWLPYVLAAGLLFAAIYLFLENKKLKDSLGKLTRDYNWVKQFEGKANGLEEEVKKKDAAITELTTEKKKLEKKIKEQEMDLKFREDQLNQLTTAASSPSPNIQSNTAPALAAKAPPVQSPKAPAFTTKYARYADMGDGFSNAALLDQPDGETIFELRLAPNNTGEFRVTSDPDGQHYALSNAAYFLGKTCVYDAFPSGDKVMINTEKWGTVNLTGGKWMITRPATINFT